jgi:acyl-CoA thioester hydrolase
VRRVRPRRLTAPPLNATSAPMTQTAPPAPPVSTQAPPPPLECYRGVCNAWECDENGHMNVRFYVQRAWEGLAGLAAALSLPDTFRARANATLLPIDQHIRFLREARPGAPLSMVCGVVAVGETTAKIYQEIRHGDGAPCAAITTLVAHADSLSGKAFAWPARAAPLWAALACTPPAHGLARSIDLTRMPGDATLAQADALNAPAIGRGAILPTEVDALSRMRPDVVIGRISDAAPNLLAGWRAAAAAEAGAGAHNAGAAVVEYRIMYRRWPRAGDGFVVRSAVTEVLEKTMHLAHWMLDPVSGEAWATAEAVALTFDLATRKTIAPSAQARAALEAASIPAMTL